MTPWRNRWTIATFVTLTAVGCDASDPDVVVEQARCVPYEEPDHSSVTYDDEFFLATMTCDAGFRLSGSAERRCYTPDPDTAFWLAASAACVPELFVDVANGLEWEAAPASDTMSAAEAIAHCNALELGGHDDFRLVSIREAYAFAFGNPTTDVLTLGGPFVGILGGYEFWTRDTDSVVPEKGYDFGFWAPGEVHFSGPLLTAPRRALCVRGDDLPGPALTDNGNGTVSDATTGLTWQQVPNSTQRTYAGSVAFCPTLSLVGGGWRIPTPEEYATLIDSTKAYGIDRTTFLIGTTNVFWTSVSGMTAGFPIYIRDGLNPGDAYHVLCVR